MIDEARVQSALSDGDLGRPLLAYEVVTSTNDVLSELLQKGLAEGTAVVADEQTSGRGRMRTRWFCPRGKGLLISVALSPEPIDGLSSLLIALCAVSTSKSLRSYRLPARISFPNDIVVERKKIAGSLVERKSIGPNQWFIIGVGVNLNLLPHELPPQLDRPATSLLAETGREVDITEFAILFLKNLTRTYRLLTGGRVDELIQQWQELLLREERMAFRQGNHLYSGEVLEIHPLHGVTLRLDSGTIMTLEPEYLRGVHL